MKIFISYKRDSGIDIAARVKDFFVAKGNSVFYDVASMRIGDFEKQIENNIAESDCFLLLLTPGALESDWVQKEIRCAFKNPKINIVPLFVPSFTVPQNLPKDIAAVLHYHGITYNALLFDQVMMKLNELLAGGEQSKTKFELRTQLNNLYSTCIDYKNALNCGDNKKYHTSLSSLVQQLQNLYGFYEKNRITDAKSAQMAYAICEKWNEFIPHYNAFSNNPDRASESAQKEGDILSRIFSEFVELIVTTRNKLEA